jgi:Polysaccharide pyruvyl transferase
VHGYRSPLDRRGRAPWRLWQLLDRRVQPNEAPGCSGRDVWRLLRRKNPGCFLILEAALQALEQRLPNTLFDIYSEDAIARFQGLREEVVHDRVLRFFSSQWGTTLLETILASYDALILGGDIILAPPPSPSVFLLESSVFQQSPGPPVFYNAAHTALSADEILDGPHSERFRDLCNRSSYVGVRTEYARDALRTLGYADRVVFCPDPTLSLDLNRLIHGIDVTPLKREKKVLGISIMAHLIEALADAIAADAGVREEFDVWIYPYSRQYNHIESVLRIRQRYGEMFHYIDRYRDPLETVALMSQFDASINDTYHGTIVALLLGIPFLVIDREDAARSRNRSLLRLVSREDCIMASRLHGFTDEADNLLLGDALVERWSGALRRLRASPLRSTTDLSAARALIDAHFDRIAHGISPSGPRVSTTRPLST